MLEMAAIKRYRQKEGGVTAMEMIIVLTIILMIIAMSASSITELFNASDTTANTNNVLSLYTAVRSFESGGGYGAEGEDLTQMLLKTQSVPSGLATTEGSIMNQWHGSIKIAVTNNGYGFDITYPDVPLNVATKLAWQLLGSGNFSSITIGQTKIEAPGSLKEVVDAITAEKGDGITLIFSVHGAAD